MNLNENILNDLSSHKHTHFLQAFESFVSFQQYDQLLEDICQQEEFLVI